MTKQRKEFYNTKRLMQAEIVIHTTPEVFKVSTFTYLYNEKYPDDALSALQANRVIQLLIKRGMVEKVGLRGFYTVVKRMRNQRRYYATLLKDKEEAKKG